MKIIIKILLILFALALLLATFKSFAPSFSFTNPLKLNSYKAPDYAIIPDSHGYDNQVGYGYYAADYNTYLPSKGTSLAYQSTYYDNTSGQRFYSEDFNQYAEYKTSNKIGYKYYKSDQEDFGEYNDPNTGYRYYSGGKKPFR